MLEKIEEYAGGDKELQINLLWNYVDSLEEIFEFIENDAYMRVIRVLEGHCMFLESILKESEDEEDTFEVDEDYTWPCECEECLREVDKYDETLSTDYNTTLTADETANDMISVLKKGIDELNEHSRRFENSIKGTDYAYGGFMSEDDDY